MPYRIDFRNPSPDAIDRLIELGALDVDRSDDGTVAALMPDDMSPERVAAALGVSDVIVSPATGRDDGSVWLLRPREVLVAGLRIAPASEPPASGTLRLHDTPAFGTGLHPTTALCLELIAEGVRDDAPQALLDVGTGSGILALGGLMFGVPRATGLDVDDEAVRVALENARLNDRALQFEALHGGPDIASGRWPLVVANVLAAPLIEMAPQLVQRLGHRGRLVLSGIAESLEGEVDHTYRRLGMRRLESRSRGGWVALVMQASW